MFLDSDVYTPFRDVIIPSGNGTTQIDHVVVSAFGIFVIETKNMKGWIFGRETDARWMQVLSRKNKYPFQNPLRQNYCHTKSLADFLGLDHSLFHSIVFFAGGCRFKTTMPPSVISSNLPSYIKQFTGRLLDEVRLVKIVEKIKALKTDPDLTPQNHLSNLNRTRNSHV